MALAAFNGQATDLKGNVVTAFQVEVKREVSGQPLAAIFSDRDGDTPLANPFTPDAGGNGHFRFHVLGGAYRIRIFTTGGDVAIWRYVAVGTAGESDDAIQFPGFTLLWDTGTADADPGGGEIRANNADLSAATVLYVSKTNAGGSAIGTRLLELGDAGKAVKDRIIITRSDQAQASFQVDSVAEGDGSPAAYVKITVSDHDGETSFNVGEPVSLQPVISGADGADGEGSGDVVGPAGGVSDGDAAVFDGATGKLIAGAGAAPALAGHSHTISDVTGLQAALDGKAATDRQVTDMGGITVSTSDPTGGADGDLWLKREA